MYKRSKIHVRKNFLTSHSSPRQQRSSLSHIGKHPPFFLSIFSHSLSFFISCRDWFCAALRIQREGLLKQQDDHYASWEEHCFSMKHMSQLEDAITGLAFKIELQDQELALTTDKVYLQQFRMLGRPTFVGPFQAMEPFLQFIHCLQIVFKTKEVSISSEKIQIIGILISKTNLLAFYVTKAKYFSGKSWEDFQAPLFSFALPPHWQTKLKKQIFNLWMGEAELFMGYSTQVWTL